MGLSSSYLYNIESREQNFKFSVLFYAVSTERPTRIRVSGMSTVLSMTWSPRLSSLTGDSCGPVRITMVMYSLMSSLRVRLLVILGDDMN